MSVRMQMERAVLLQYQRLPTLRSEFSGLDTLLGNDETITFEDTLDNPYEKPERRVDLHAAMEYISHGKFL